MSAPGPAALTDSRLAALCAEETRNSFREYETSFDAIVARARERFLARDWRGAHDDAAERLHLYSKKLDSLRRIEELRDHLGRNIQEALALEVALLRVFAR